MSTKQEHHFELNDDFVSIQKNVTACMQCGTCSGSCPNAFAMDYTPRQLWRLVQLGEKEVVFNSKTFFLCSTCYYCTLRCPRGLPLTETIEKLKALAAKDDIGTHRESIKFYAAFMETIRRYGRIGDRACLGRPGDDFGGPTRGQAPGA